MLTRHRLPKAVRRLLAQAQTLASDQVAARELVSAIDNPVITADGRVVSNGDFHGASVACVLDFLAIIAADVASIAERRKDRFLDVARNRGLNAFLADDPGVDSGHMIAQYAKAAIVSELKRLANPSSVESIPSSAMQEDHVSMGWSAARKLRRSVDGMARVIAIELLTAAHALDLRAPLEPAPATAAVLTGLRLSVAGPGPDRYLAPEIQGCRRLCPLRSRPRRRRVRDQLAPLNTGVSMTDTRLVLSAATSLLIRSKPRRCRGSPLSLTSCLRVAVSDTSEEVATSVLAADHALGRKFCQDEPDCRAARTQLLCYLCAALVMFEGEVAFDCLADVVALGWSAVLRSWWPSGAGLTGFRCAGRAGGVRAEVAKPPPDAGRGEAAGLGRLLPGPPEVFG
jgi:Aromatic amino acid lyase